MTSARESFLGDAMKGWMLNGQQIAAGVVVKVRSIGFCQPNPSFPG